MWRLEPMRPEDIPFVRAVERESFETTWNEEAFLNELKQNPAAHYLVLKSAEGELQGYAGLWMVEDEAHITSIAIAPGVRGGGLGRRLLGGLLRRCLELGARWCTLEVREDNVPAQKLYQRFGFVRVGARKAYYQGGQDAVIMWAGNLLSQRYQERLAELAPVAGA